MSLASETLVQANGWSDIADNNEINQDRLQFSHKIAKIFGTIEGKEVLDAMVKKYLLATIANDTDTQIAIGRKQGRCDVVKYILSEIEISNKA